MINPCLVPAAEASARNELSALGGSRCRQGAWSWPERYKWRQQNRVTFGTELFSLARCASALAFVTTTPVGPIRRDTGYRVPRLQAPARSVDDGVAAETFGLPVAISFGIDEAC